MIKYKTDSPVIMRLWFVSILVLSAISPFWIHKTYSLVMSAVASLILAYIAYKWIKARALR